MNIRILALLAAMAVSVTASGLRAADSSIAVTDVALAGGTVQIDFTSVPGLTALKVRGSQDLLEWTDDLTTLSVITEISPGVYRANINISGTEPGRYFLRIEGVPPPVNAPPVLITPGDRLISPGNPFRATLFAADADAGDTLRFSLAGGPEGMAVDPVSGLLTWTPLEGETGSRAVTVRVEDTAGAADTGSFTITLTEWEVEDFSRRAPVLTVPADGAILIGETFTAAASAANDDPGDTLTFSLPAAPEGMVINTASGAISWTPAAAGTGRHEVTVRVTDGSGLSDFGAFAVTARMPNRGPVAVGDGYVTPRGETTTVPAPGVMLNDSDPDGDALTAALVEDVKNGTLHFRQDGSFDYRPGIPEIQPRLAYGFQRLDGAAFKVNADNAPVAADLNGDGRPEIIAIGQRNSGIGNTGWLVALTLDTATQTLSPLWTFKGGVGSPISIYNARDPAVGDVDGDGTPEVVVGGQCRGEILIFSNTGELLVNTQADKSVGPGTAGGADCYVGGGHHTLQLADLDGDGAAEIITPYRGTNLRVYNGQGLVVWERAAEAGTSNVSAGALVADFDLDGKQDIYFAGTMFDAEGNVRWRLSDPPSRVGERFLAVANLDDDPFGEIVISTGRNPNVLRVVEHDGACKWVAVNSSASPVGSGCGAPLPFPNSRGPNQSELLVADVQGDGFPEIIACSSESTYNHVTVFNRDGTILWQVEATIGETVMGQLDVTAFDFNGDGIMEIVVSGRHGTIFLSGKDGSTVFEIPWDERNPGRPSAAPELSPIVVDLENDGHAELVIAGRDSNLTPNAGIFVYKDVNDRWMPTRSVWNQARYFITNVNADGSIPRKAAVNWLTPGLNNYGINTPMPDETKGADRFTYRVSDGALTSNEASVHLEIRARNHPPSILSSPLLIALPDQPYRYKVIGMDSNAGDAVSFSLGKGPEGMTLDADDVLRWSPVDASRGNHPVVVVARDREGAAATQSFSLAVGDPQPVPDVTGRPRAEALTALQTAGFVPGRVSQEEHPSVSADVVIRQTPPGGAVERPGAAVALVISAGKGARHTDADGDGFTPDQGDGEDQNPAIHPGANDPPGDGIDQDCDGIDGNLTLALILVEPPDAFILTNQSLPLTARGVFTDGTSQNLTSVVTWSSGAARFSSAAPGTFEITATRGGVTGKATVTVAARTADDAPPLAEITAPVGGGSITEPVEIRGGAADANFLKYELSRAPAGTEEFTVFHESATPVTAGVLGRLDPTLLLNDQYTVRLTVYDRGGNESAAETTVLVEEAMKPGNFTLTFTDLQIPMSGLPISVTRMYDSRDKARGDFGTGWRLGLRTLKIRASRVPGTGWSVAKSGLSFGLAEEDEHIISVTLPNGRVESFEMVVSPEVSPIVPFPPSVLKASFRPRFGTQGKLESLENNTLSILDPQPGPVELMDDSTHTPYNPQRFRYTARNGAVYILHMRDGLESVTEPNGNTLTFKADGIFHSDGTAVRFTRDTFGRVTVITDPAGRTRRYGYDGNGDLRSCTDGENKVTSYKYDRRHGLLEIIDPSGKTGIRQEFDDDGRLTAIVDGGGHRTEFTRDIAGREETQVDARGFAQRLVYDGKGNVLLRERTVTIDGAPVVARERFEYDGRSNVIRETDADGVVTLTEYDARDNIVRIVVDPEGLNLVTVFTYDGADNLLTETDPLGQVTRHTYTPAGSPATITDASGHTRRFLYDSLGRLIAQVDPAGTVTSSAYGPEGRVIFTDVTGPDGNLLARAGYAYDANGNVKEQTVYRMAEGALTGFTTTYTYDGNNRQVSETDPLGNVTRTEYNASGLAAAAVNPRGHRTLYEYEDRNLRSAIRYPDGTAVSQVHDGAGNLVETLDAEGRRTRFVYDEFNRQVAEERADGSLVRTVLSPGGRETAIIDAAGNRTDHEYDAAGRLVKTLLPEVTDGRTGLRVRPVITHTWDAAGRRTSTTDPNGNVTRFEYDAPGRLTAETRPDGITVRKSYDAAGRLISQTDEQGRVTTYAYNGRGNLLSVTQPPPGEGEPAPVTRFTYDLTGSLLTRTDVLGRVTRFEYDAAGRRTRTILPSGHFAAAVYDAAGNVTSQTDFNGAATRMEHDARNRVTRARYADGNVAEYAYRPGGALASASDAAGTVAFTRDALDRVLTRRDPHGVTLIYTYDARGNQTSVSSPARSVSFEYDALNRLSRVADPSGAVSFAFDPNGNRVTETHPNGVVTTRAFDGNNRTVTMAHHGPGNRLLRSFSYTMTAGGRRETVTESGGAVETFKYDALGRLAEERRTGDDEARHLVHRYDAAGNRISLTRSGIVETSEYDVNDRLTRAGDTVFTYDGNGNRLSAAGLGFSTFYEWDSRDRLTATRTAAGTTAYTYDVNANRVAVSGPGGVRRFVIDEQSTTGYPQVLEERGADNAVLASFLYGTTPLRKNDGEARTYHGDAHGSVRLLSGPGGSVSAVFNYEGFGSLTKPAAAADGAHLFSGERLDAASGLYNLRARQYDPATASFLSRDPHPGEPAAPATLHPYLYAGMDPVNLLDPSGRFSVSEISIVQSINNYTRALTEVPRVCAAKNSAEMADTAVTAIVLANSAFVASMQYFAPKRIDEEARIFSFKRENSKIKEFHIGLKFPNTVNIKGKTANQFRGRDKAFGVAFNLQTGEVSGDAGLDFPIYEYKAGCGELIKAFVITLKTRLEGKADLIGVDRGSGGFRLKAGLGIDGPFSTFKATVPLLEYP